MSKYSTVYNCPRNSTGFLSNVFVEIVDIVDIIGRLLWTLDIVDIVDICQDFAHLVAPELKCHLET